MKKRDRHDLMVGLAFLAPNIFGVLVFTAFPLLFSIFMAFSNWDLRLHNMFKDDALEFVGFDNFVRLFSEGQLSQYFGNTMFFMMGIPLGMACSLIAAIFLSKKLDCGNKKMYTWLVSFFVLVIGIGFLCVVGMGGSGMTLLLLGCAALVMIMGLGGQQTAYRTFFYTPHFTAGVATFILWKKLYNPNTGVFTTAVTPVLNKIEGIVNNTSPQLYLILGCLGYAALAALFTYCINKYGRMWRDGDMGSLGFAILSVIQSIPLICMVNWDASQGFKGLLAVIFCGLVLLWQIGLCFKTEPIEKALALKGMENQMIFCLCIMVLQFIALGMSVVILSLPAMAQAGLSSPMWLTNYHWAKPSIMMMGLWAAVGSNNMLLYLAALTNVPEDLYEAADIDGATPLDKFWNVTWPQLAPTTFFIFIMSVIGGLQGGMEMAKTMTQGGPAGSTTTLSYFIYTEGFETGRLGYSAAVAWTLFAMVSVVTMVNWKFGNKK
jgi:multiple sugar transport system permease protein